MTVLDLEYVRPHLPKNYPEEKVGEATPGVPPAGGNNHRGERGRSHGVPPAPAGGTPGGAPLGERTASVASGISATAVTPPESCGGAGDQLKRPCRPRRASETGGLPLLQALQALQALQV